MFWCDAEKNYRLQFCATRTFLSGGPKAGEGGEAGKGCMGWKFPPSPPLPPFAGSFSKTVSALGGRVGAIDQLLRSRGRMFWKSQFFILVIPVLSRTRDTGMKKLRNRCKPSLNGLTPHLQPLHKAKCYNSVRTKLGQINGLCRDCVSQSFVGDVPSENLIHSIQQVVLAVHG